MRRRSLAEPRPRLTPSLDLRAPVLDFKGLTRGLWGCGLQAPGTLGLLPPASPQTLPSPSPAGRISCCSSPPASRVSDPRTQGWGRGEVRLRQVNAWWEGDCAGEPGLMGGLCGGGIWRYRSPAGSPDGVGLVEEGIESRYEHRKVGNTWPFFQILSPPGTRTSAKVSGLQGHVGCSGWAAAWH